MKKLITLLVTIAMIGVMLTGCGGSGKEVTADPAKLAEDETRVKNQSDLYSSYNADEVKNLDNAIIKTSGNYAVLCVTNDTAAAEKVLKEAGF